MKKKNFDINTWLPIFIFVLVFAIFAIISPKKFLNASNLINIFEQSVGTILAGLGMIFVAAMAGTDITTGVVAALVGCFGLLVADKTGAPIMFFVMAIVIGLASGLLMGWLNARRKVNSFMASLALLIGYRALVSLVLGDNSYYLPLSLSFLNKTVVKLIVTIVMFLIILYIWDFTRLGKYVRGIGENEVAIAHTGVNVTKIKFIAFMISGLMAAIAGIFVVARVGGTNNTIGNGFEMKVMMALYIAGIPVRGGEGSKLYKLIFGALTVMVLENGLVLVGLNSSGAQLIRGIVLLAAVALSSQIAKRMAYVGQEGAHNQKEDAEDAAA